MSLEVFIIKEFNLTEAPAKIFVFFTRIQEILPLANTQFSRIKYHVSLRYLFNIISSKLL